MDKAEWEEWRLLDSTREFFKALEQQQLTVQQRWAQGHFSSANGGETLQMNSEAIGRVGQLKEIGDMDYEQYCEYAGKRTSPKELGLQPERAQDSGFTNSGETDESWRNSDSRPIGGA